MLLRCEDSVRMEAGFRKYVHREVDHKRLAEKEKKKKKKETPGQPLNGSWDSWIPAKYWTRPLTFFWSRSLAVKCACHASTSFYPNEFLIWFLASAAWDKRVAGNPTDNCWNENCANVVPSAGDDDEILGNWRDIKGHQGSCCSRWNGHPVCTHFAPIQGWFSNVELWLGKGYPFIFTDFPWIRGLGRRRRRRSWGMEARCCERQWHNLYKISVCPGLKINYRWLLITVGVRFGTSLLLLFLVFFGVTITCLISESIFWVSELNLLQKESVQLLVFVSSSKKYTIDRIWYLNLNI